MLMMMFLIMLGEEPVKAEFQPRVLGLALTVAEPDRAREFLVEALDFQVVSKAANTCLLQREGVQVLLEPGVREPERRHDTLYLNFRVDDLAAETARCLSLGGELMNETPMQSQIGPFNGIRLPGSKHRIHLMQIEGLPGKPGIFNTSLRVGNMGTEEAFYSRLGFTIFSRDYLPETLPFNRSGAMSLVLHPATPGQKPRCAQTFILLGSDPKLASRLERAGIQIQNNRFRAPSGYGFRLAGADEPIHIP